MRTCTTGPHSLKDFRSGFPRKIQIQNEKMRARVLACIDLVEKSCRSFSVSHDEKVTRHGVLFKCFYYEFYVCRVIFSQKNLAKGLVKHRLSLVLPPEA